MSDKPRKELQKTSTTFPRGTTVLYEPLVVGDQMVIRGAGRRETCVRAATKEEAAAIRIARLAATNQEPEV